MKEKNNLKVFFRLTRRKCIRKIDVIQQKFIINGIVPIFTKITKKTYDQQVQINQLHIETGKRFSDQQLWLCKNFFALMNSHTPNKKYIKKIIPTLPE